MGLQICQQVIASKVHMKGSKKEMPEFGTMGVDWEERINLDRLRRERLQRAKDALDKSDLNALFVFRLEDVRYLTSFRSHMGPVAILGLAAVVLPRGGDPILCTLDWFFAQIA